MKRFQVHIEGFTVDGEWWEQPDFVTRYAAQISCPVKGCHNFYTSQQKRTAISAQSKVRESLRKHIKSKHKGS